MSKSMFDPSQFDKDAQKSAKDLFEQFGRTKDDERGEIQEGPPLVFGRIAQKGVTNERGQSIVMPGAIVFFTSTDSAGEYDRIQPRRTMDEMPDEMPPFIGVFAGGTKGLIYWGKGTPTKGKEPLYRWMDGDPLPVDETTKQYHQLADPVRIFVVALQLSEEEAANFGMPFYPVVMQFTKSAIGPIQKYHQWVRGHGAADLATLLGLRQEMYWHDIVTRVECEYTPRKGGYYLPTFSYERLVDQAIVPSVRALRETSLDRMLPAGAEIEILDEE